MKPKKIKPHSPNDIVLTNIVPARMKMISDALPNMAITFVTTCCPTRAAMVATPKKKSAATYKYKM
jgi:hypothetical protein